MCLHEVTTRTLLDSENFCSSNAVQLNLVSSFPFTTFSAPTEIIPWLKTLADQHWLDPACGDGKCEAFEFPAYSRFGCRPDCSDLSAVAVDVHPLQVDLYWDFVHSTDRKVVSLPPTSLLGLATWNVCPIDAPHGT